MIFCPRTARGGSRASCAGPETARSCAGPETARSCAGPETARSCADPKIARFFLFARVPRGLARVLRRPEGRTSCAGPETARSCAGPRTARFVHAPARRSHVSVCPREYATWRQIMGIYGFQRLRLDCAGKDPISASRGRCGVRRGALSGAHAWRFSRCCYRGAPSPRTYVGRDLAAHVAKLRAVVAKTTARAARK